MLSDSVALCSQQGHHRPILCLDGILHIKDTLLLVKKSRVVILVVNFLFSSHFRVPTAQGKQGKWQKKDSLSGKTQGIWKFCQSTGKTQGILLSQVVNVLILKVKAIAIVAIKKIHFFQKLDRSAKSVLCV